MQRTLGLDGKVCKFPLMSFQGDRPQNSHVPRGFADHQAPEKLLRHQKDHSPSAIPDLKMRNTILSIKPAINFIAYRFPLPPKKWLFGKINRDIKMKYN